LKSPRCRIQLRLALACLGLASGSLAAAQARPAPAPLVPPDPSLRAGRLPNGLRYFLLPRFTEPGHVSLRLIVQAGSLDERADERGYAHFVEHMAFAGTVHYPAGKLVLFLQGIGLGFGADLNADTSFTHTIYKLDLPAGRYLPQGLEVLRDYADGLTFPDYALDRQRGVILSELRARATAQSEFSREWLALLYAGTALPQRMPIGEASLITRADAAGLRAFYRRCYRPERMIVLVVGDIDPAAVEPLLRQFATMASPGRPVSPAALVLPAGTALTAATLVSPLQTSAAADVVALVPHPRDTVSDLEAWEADQLVISLLNRRLAERAGADPRIGRAFATVEAGPDQWYSHFRLEAQASTQEWPRAVGLLERELRRARLQGFQPEEVAEAVSSLGASLESYRDGAATFEPTTLADAVAARLAAGRSWPDLDAEIQLSSDFLANFKAADAARALGALFPENNLHLIVSRPVPLPDGAAALLAAYRASAGQPLGAALTVEAGLPLFHYGDIPPAGTVTLQRTLPDLRFTAITFANGVRLNLRPSQGESRRFGLSLRLGRGVADTPPDQPRLEILALALLGSADLGRNTRDEITRLLRLHAIEFNADLEDSQVCFTATGPAAELPFALRLVTALLSDLKLDPAQWPKAVSQYAATQRREVSSTLGWARNELLYQVAGADPRLRFSSAAQVNRYGFADVGAWLQRHWLEGPLEIGLTGDIAPQETTAAVARTLGALPPRRQFPSAPDERLVLRTTPYRRTEVLPLPDAAAALRMAWPAGAAREVRDQAALQLAIDALVDRLRLKVREDLGATYAPGGGVYDYAPQPDFQFGWIELTFDPKQAQALGLAVLQLADALAQQGLTPEEFARLREPRRAQTAARLGSDGWWLKQVLVRAQSQPQVLSDVRAWESAYSQITREDVNRAAARYLRAANATGILIIPQAPAPR
jgi:zinc protease